MQIEAVGARFRHGMTTYSFSPNGKQYHLGDKVLVQTEKGDDIVTIVQEAQMIDASELEDSLKNVLRLATEQEIKMADENDKKAQSYKDEIVEITKSMDVDMKIISVESNYDFSRMTVNFTSDGRVDFRALAKKLAEKYKTRVELRQIGPRDAVRCMGGLGICGKECCCSQGYGLSDHISIKMAKNQNLSLNPNSISGVCGKLLCCLAYENETYAESLKSMPKVGSVVSTKDGKGVVMYNDLLNRRVSVKFEDENSSEIKEYDEKDVKFDRK